MVKKAVLCGINYNNTDIQLKGCENDVLHMKQLLINWCDYLEDNIICLTQETVVPIKSNIVSSLNWLISDVKENDSIVFYYSGHGSFVKDKNGDESDGYDELIIPSDFEENGVIKDDWVFSNFISKIPKNVNAFIFSDCCHSGTIVDLKYNLKYQGKDFVISEENSKTVDANVFCLSACFDNQKAEETKLENVHQGVFSYFLQNSLRNRITEKAIAPFLFKDLLKEIYQNLIENNFEQRCQLSVGKLQDLEQYKTF